MGPASFFSYLKHRKGIVVPHSKVLGAEITVNSQTIKVLEADSNSDITKCSGTAVPTDGGSGFAKGCGFVLSNALPGTNPNYVNIGTNTDCGFVPDGSIFGALTAFVTLTPSQINNCFTTPIEILPAIPGKAYIIDVVTSRLDFNTTPYVVANPGQKPVIIDEKDVYAWNDIDSAQMTDTASSMLVASAQWIGGTAPYIINSTIPGGDLFNTAIQVKAPNSNPSGGDSNMYLTIQYHLVNQP